MLEILHILSAILTIIFSLCNVPVGFYIAGTIVLVLSWGGVLLGGIKRPGSIIFFTAAGLIFALIFSYNIYDNILFALSIELLYTCIKGLIMYKLFFK